MSINEPVNNKVNQSIMTGPVFENKLWTTSFVLICLSNISVYVAFQGLQVTLPIYIKDFGGSESVAGLSLAFLTLAAVFSRPFTGWGLDNYGRKIILAIGLLAFFLPTLVFTFMVGIVPLLILRLVQGLAWGIANTAQGTVASDVIPPERIGKGIGFYGMTISISMAFAPALTLWIVDAFSFRVLFMTLSVLTLVSLALAMAIKYPKLAPLQKKTKLVVYEKLALRPSLIILLVALTYSSVPTFLALFVREIGITTTGIFFTAMAFSTLISRPFAGTIIDLKGRRGYDIIVFFGIIAMFLSMILIPHIDSSWFLVLTGTLFGIGFGSVQPSMLALTISMVPGERRGAANATYWSAFDIGVAAGCAIWGVIASYFGYAVMFYMNVLPIILAGIIYWFSRRQIPKKV